MTRVKKLLNQLEDFYKASTGKLSRKPFEVFKNPSLKEIANLLKTNLLTDTDKDPYLRAWVDGEDIYLFNSVVTTHEDVRCILDFSTDTQLPLFLQFDCLDCISVVLLTDSYADTENMSRETLQKYIEGNKIRDYINQNTKFMISKPFKEEDGSVNANGAAPSPTASRRLKKRKKILR
jgi:hypothetical protein